MFRGIATISLYADDVVAARDWYAELLGVDAYYAMPEPPEAPAYVEFRVGTTRMNWASSTAGMRPAAYRMGREVPWSSGTSTTWLRPW